MKHHDWAVFSRVVIDGGPRQWGPKPADPVPESPDRETLFLQPGQLGTYLEVIPGAPGQWRWVPNL